MIGAMFDRAAEVELCNAQDWAWFDDAPDGTERIILYGTCNRPRGHASRWHAELGNDGQSLAEWSGPRESRAPEGVPVWTSGA